MDPVKDEVGMQMEQCGPSDPESLTESNGRKNGEWLKAAIHQMSFEVILKVLIDVSFVVTL